jgi:hypothetical protein
MIIIKQRLSSVNFSKGILNESLFRLVREALTAKDKEMAITMFNGGATKGSIAQHFGVAR